MTDVKVRNVESTLTLDGPTSSSNEDQLVARVVRRVLRELDRRERRARECAGEARFDKDLY